MGRENAMTQPSEFEEVMALEQRLSEELRHTLKLVPQSQRELFVTELAKWYRTAHNASVAAQIAAAERRVLGQLKPYLEKYEFTGDPIVGKFNELAALSGQEPAKPCPKCGMPDPDHTPDDPRHMSDEAWAKMSKPASPRVYPDTNYTNAIHMPAKPCKTCSGSGLYGFVHGQHMPCPACGATGVAK